MLTSNEYTLEHKIELKRGLFAKINVLSAVFKLLFLACAITAIWCLWTLIPSAVALVLAVVLDINRQKLVFTVRYRVEHGVLTVTKIGLNGKTETLKEIKTAEIDEISVVDELPQNATAYFDRDRIGDEIIIYVRKGSDSFYILADEYAYSIICAAKEDI